jgi:hypothetical protein
MFKSETPRNFVRKNVPPLNEFESAFKTESRQLDSKFRLVEDKLGSQELFLSSQEGEDLRLNDYLPKGVEFRGGPEGKFSCGTQSLEHPDGELINIHQVSFDSEIIDTAYGRLALLHEIGHGIDYVENNGDKEAESRFVIRNIRRDIINGADYMWMDESEEKQKWFLEEFKERWRNAAKKYTEKDGLKFRYKDLIDALQEFVRSERDAWSNGLKLYRKIKAERGIDILEGARTSEIFESANNALATYEAAYGLILDDYNSKGSIRKFIEGYLT